jgi:hypothetical protein
MIDNLPKKFKTHSRVLTDFVKSSITYYFNHKCFKILKNKKAKLDDSIDMRFNASSNDNNRVQNAWRSNIAIPMVRESFLSQRAITSGAFSTPPLVTVMPDGYTPFENAKRMNSVVTTVIRNTRFQERTLEPVIESCSRYGCAVVVSYFDFKTQSQMKTVEDTMQGVFLGYKRAKEEKSRSGIFSDKIHILNYGQQPDQPDPEKARYRFYVERIPVHQIANEAKEAEAEGNGNIYIKDNIRELIEKAKKGSVKSQNYYNENQEETAHLMFVDRFHWYGKLDFKGNRDDNTTYYVQMAGDKIIAIQENPHDEDLIPINIYCFDPRPEYWWGSASAENQIPGENYLQMALSMTADSTMQELQRFVFYDTGTGINTTRMNEAAKNGGFIPFDRKQGQSLKDIFYQYQFPGISTQNLNYIVSEVKEASQRVGNKTDFTRQPNEGGLKNKTAEAARMMGQQGNSQESFYLRQFAYGLRANVRTMIILIKQMFDHVIIIRPSNMSDPIEIIKRDILGDYNPLVRTSLTQNQALRSQRLQNLMTMVMNFKGAQDPAFVRFNLIPIVREFTKDILENSVDIDQTYPEETPQEHQQMIAQQQGMGMGAMQGAGGQQMSPPFNQGALANVA